ncbi:MAG: Sensor protein ChvG, partial [Pseudomonadota bacterium]
MLKDAPAPIPEHRDVEPPSAFEPSRRQTAAHGGIGWLAGFAGKSLTFLKARSVRALVVVRRALSGVGPKTERPGFVGRALNHPLIAVHGARLWQWLGSTAIVRFFKRTLLRRILFANLVGLLVLLVGAGLVSRSQRWLVDAKVESLSAQARMVAVAIAANAKVERDGITLDPDRLPEVDGSRVPFRDDGFAALELSIAPERVAPILRRLIQTGGIRARVYDQTGTLIVDSAPIFTRNPGQTRSDGAVPPTGAERARVRNAWTRFWAWAFEPGLPVYKEIGSANGASYPEVREALGGQMTRMLLLSDAGEQIVTVAAPIQQRRTIQGVVLLSSLPGEIDRLYEKERNAFLALALLAALASVVMSLMLARTIAGPMQRLSNAADSVSVSVKASHELPDLSDRQDEIGRLAQSFRGMTANLLRRIEASDRFAQDVAHELKNPVAAARSTAEALAYAKTEERREHLVRQMKGELVRLNRLISDVSNASRLDAELALQETVPLDLRSVIGNVVAVMRDIHSDTGVTVTLTVEPSADTLET